MSFQLRAEEWDRRQEAQEGLRCQSPNRLHHFIFYKHFMMHEIEAKIGKEQTSTETIRRMVLARLRKENKKAAEPICLTRSRALTIISSFFSFLVIVHVLSKYEQKREVLNKNGEWYMRPIGMITSGRFEFLT